MPAAKGEQLNAATSAAKGTQAAEKLPARLPTHSHTARQIELTRPITTTKDGAPNARGAALETGAARANSEETHFSVSRATPRRVSSRAPGSHAGSIDVRHPVSMPTGPQRVRWTDHAYVKANVLGAAREDVERAVIDRHPARQTNTGAAQWRLLSGPWIILYDHPDGDDQTTARIVTLWRRR